MEWYLCGEGSNVQVYFNDKIILSICARCSSLEDNQFEQILHGFMVVCDAVIKPFLVA